MRAPRGCEGAGTTGSGQRAQRPAPFPPTPDQSGSSGAPQPITPSCGARTLAKMIPGLKELRGRPLDHGQWRRRGRGSVSCPVGPAAPKRSQPDKSREYWHGWLPTIWVDRISPLKIKGRRSRSCRRPTTTSYTLSWPSWEVLDQIFFSEEGHLELGRGNHPVQEQICTLGRKWIEGAREGIRREVTREDLTEVIKGME